MSNFVYRVFDTVVRCQSFYSASQQLNVTPSAVSHSINQLEEKLGFPLLIRSRSGMRLTSDGEKILPLIQDILNAEYSLLQVTNDIKGLHTGSIKIGAFSSACVNWLPSILSKFSQLHPTIDLSIVQGSFEDINKKTKIGDIDIGFTTLPVDENLTVEPLIKDPIYCVTPSHFIPKNGESITQEDLIDQRFILQKMDYSRDTKFVLDTYDVKMSAINFSIDDQSIIAMVEAGIGFGILPELALKKLQGEVNIYPFNQVFTRQIVLVTNKTKMISPTTSKMIQHIKQFIGINSDK